MFTQDRGYSGKDITAAEEGHSMMKIEPEHGASTSQATGGVVSNVDEEGVL